MLEIKPKTDNSDYQNQKQIQNFDVNSEISNAFMNVNAYCIELERESLEIERERERPVEGEICRGDCVVGFGLGALGNGVSEF